MMRLVVLVPVAVLVGLLCGCSSQAANSRMHESGQPQETTGYGSLSTEPRHGDERQGTPGFSRDPTSEGQRSPAL